MRAWRRSGGGRAQQWAKQRRASAAAGRAAEGELGEEEDSGWDGELPRARPPPPPCPSGCPTAPATKASRPSIAP
uniref:Uncharacterized protein n=1 Tax=Oryza glumipatula TaxID=40148 RepID=A0A0D9ZA47_9ORYZ